MTKVATSGERVKSTHNNVWRFLVFLFFFFFFGAEIGKISIFLG